mgnify:CR=1 FL=1
MLVIFLGLYFPAFFALTMENTNMITAIIPVSKMRLGFKFYPFMNTKHFKSSCVLYNTKPDISPSVLIANAFIPFSFPDDV